MSLLELPPRTILSEGGGGGAQAKGGKGGKGGPGGPKQMKMCCCEESCSLWGLVCSKYEYSCVDCEAGGLGDDGNEGDASPATVSGRTGGHLVSVWQHDDNEKVSAQLRQYIPSSLLMACFEYATWMFINGDVEHAADYLMWVNVLSSGAGGGASGVVESVESSAEGGRFLKHMERSSRTLLHRIYNGQDYFGNVNGFAPMTSLAMLTAYIESLESRASKIEVYANTLRDRQLDMSARKEAAEGIQITMKEFHKELLELRKNLQKQQMKSLAAKENIDSQLLSLQTKMSDLEGRLSESVTQAQEAKSRAEAKASGFDLMKILPHLATVVTMGPAGLLGSASSFAQGAMGNIGSLFDDRAGALKSMGSMMQKSLKDMSGLVTDSSASYNKQKGRVNSVITSFSSLTDTAKSFAKPFEREKALLDKANSVLKNPADLITCSPGNYKEIQGSIDQYSASIDDKGLRGEFRSLTDDIRVLSQQKNQLVMELISLAAHESNAVAQMEGAQLAIDEGAKEAWDNTDESLFALATMTMQSLQQIRNDFVFSLYLKHKAFEYETLAGTNKYTPFHVSDMSSIDSLQIANTHLEQYIAAAKQIIGRAPQTMHCAPENLVLFDQSSAVIEALNRGLAELLEGGSGTTVSVPIPVDPHDRAFYMLADVKVSSVKVAFLMDSEDYGRGSGSFKFELNHPGNPVTVVSITDENIIFSHAPRNTVVHAPMMVAEESSSKLSPQDMRYLLHSAIMDPTTKSAELGGGDLEHPVSSLKDFLAPSPLTTWSLEMTTSSFFPKAPDRFVGMAMCFDTGTFLARMDIDDCKINLE
jgi:hypothetical protein